MLNKLSALYQSTPLDKRSGFDKKNAPNKRSGFVKNSAFDKLSALAPQYHMQTRYVQATDGARLPLSMIGSGAPVVLLHAFGMDARQFLPFILPLLSQYRFYLPHFRGFGMAAEVVLPRFDFISQYAEDTARILEHIKAETRTEAVPVAAISMGALVMWAYFQRFGQQSVSHYLNIDQAPMIHHQPDCQGGVFGARQGDIFAQFTALIDKSAPYMDVADFRHLPYAIKANLLAVEQAFSMLSVGRRRSKWLIKTTSYRTPHQIALQQHGTWQHKLRCLNAYVSLPYDYRAVLSTIDIPVTMLIGARSELYAADWQQQLTKALPYGRAIVLPKSGHAVPIDAPIRFHHVLKAFIQTAYT